MVATSVGTRGDRAAACCSLTKHETISLITMLAAAWVVTGIWHRSAWCVTPRRSLSLP